MKMIAVIAGLLLASATVAAQASSVDVNYTVSGSTGDWIYDFSVTNNLGGTNDIYALSVTVADGSLTGSPAGWGQGLGALEWCNEENCGAVFPSSVAPGDTLGGFIVTSTAEDKLLSVNWQADAFGGNLGNPVFTGTVSATPLPAALPLFSAGLGLMGLFGWRRKRKNTAAIAA
jgi:hypothetical protein